MTSAAAAERALALSYAPPGSRAALDALFALDATLGGIVKATREPIVGQMRLTWWHQALGALDTAPPPAEPILSALHATVLPMGIAGAALAAMVDGWEALLDDPIDAAAYADARGATLFGIAATLLGATDAQVAAAGRGWALADLAERLSDRDHAARLRIDARAILDAAFTARWSRAARTLAALALLARFDVMPSPPPRAGPRRVARLLRLRLTGY